MTDRLTAGVNRAALNTDEAKLRTESAMAPYRRRLEDLWGKEFPAFVDYMAVATASWRQGVAALKKGVKDAPHANTLVLVGERGVPDDGQCNEQIIATLQAVKLLEGTPFHILFSGGVYGMEKLYGERPAYDLMEDFEKLTGGDYRHWCSMEQLSKNTGHQARVIGQVIQSLGFDRIVVCIPIEHIARFSATVAADLHERQLTPLFYFFGNGDWHDFLPQRGMTRAREAFGQIQKPDDPAVRMVTKLLGGEYEERLHQECDPETNASYSCPALWPSQMLSNYIAS